MGTDEHKSTDCSFCKTPTTPEQLTLVGGLWGCDPCCSGALDVAVKAWDLAEELAQYHTNDVGSSEVKEHVLKVDLRRKGGVELMARFSTEKSDGWFKRTFSPTRPDHEVGFQEFDDAVRIRAEPDQQMLLTRVLQTAGAREAVLALVRMGCSVELVGRSLFVEVRHYAKSSMPELSVVRRWSIALAIHLARESAPL